MSTSYESLVQGHARCRCCSRTGGQGPSSNTSTSSPCSQIATLAAALSDSPTGLAAWIGEKVVAWSSERLDGTPEFDRDLLLSTLTLDWTTNTIATSLLPYWAHQHAGVGLPADDPSPVPTSITIFDGERTAFPKPPRELAEPFYNVIDWSEHPVGGHFPAVAEPEILADVIRQFFRPLR